MAKYWCDFDERMTVLRMSLSDAKFSSRATGMFGWAGARTIGDLLGFTRHELSQIKNVGNTTLNEVVSRLNEYGLRLQGETSFAKDERPLYVAPDVISALGERLSAVEREIQELKEATP